MISVGPNAKADFRFLEKIQRREYEDVYKKLEGEFPKADPELLARLANAEIDSEYFDAMYYKLRYEATKWWDASQDAGNKLNQLILDARGQALEAVNTAVKSINKTVGVVFICVDSRLGTDEGTVAQMNERIRRLCPDVDSIVIARGNLDIKTMDDEQLMKHGLLRIPNPNKWKKEKDTFAENALKLVEQSHQFYDEVVNGYSEDYFG